MLTADEEAGKQLKLATISASPLFHEQIAAALRGHIPIETTCRLGYHDFQRLHVLQAEGNWLAALDISEPSPALWAAKDLDTRSGLAIIAVGGKLDQDALLELMRAGVRELVDVARPDDIVAAAHRALRKASGPEGGRAGNIHAFVPAKPGSGATVLATNVAAALAENTESATLLLDFDIRLGMTSFLLKIEGSRTIVDALEHAENLDDALWSALVCSREHLDVLGSGPVHAPLGVPSVRYSALLNFAQRQYTNICVDLPGNMEQSESATLQKAQHIFMVCTPDVSGLHMARRKAAWFDELQVRERVSVVLNRVERRMPLSLKDIEKVIQFPVRFVVPSDPDTVGAAVSRGIAIRGNSALAKQIGTLATWISSDGAHEPRPNRIRQFVEYFSISPARESDAR
jgi:pilus assembly protein CpaE